MWTLWLGALGLGSLLVWLTRATSTAVARSELAGRTGTIVVPIPASGVGTVAFEARGRRLVRPAQTSDARPVPRGAVVLLVSLRRRVVVVEALPLTTRRGDPCSKV